MRETMELGPTPSGEKCEQLGENYDSQRAVKECRVYIRQLERMFPPPGGAHFTVSSHRHDFGTYREVSVVWDDQNEEAMEYAYHVESNLPEFWDEEARKELATPVTV